MFVCGTHHFKQLFFEFWLISDESDLTTVVSINCLVDLMDELVDILPLVHALTAWDIRYELYHKKLHQVNLEKFPPKISSIRQHILWAYLQCHLWIHAPFIEDISGNPLEYGYILNKDLAPIIIPHLALPSEFSSPCNCLKCARFAHAEWNRLTVVDFASVRQRPLVNAL